MYCLLGFEGLVAEQGFGRCLDLQDTKEPIKAPPTLALHLLTAPPTPLTSACVCLLPLRRQAHQHAQGHRLHRQSLP